jgi:putative FmdB family regulatory protein
MPIYDYLCSTCKHRVEVIHGIHEPGPRFCPSCGAEGTMRKGISSPAVLFKGSGWAKKDRAATRTPAAAQSGGDDGSSGKSSGGEAAAQATGGSGDGAAGSNGGPSGANSPTSGSTSDTRESRSTGDGRSSREGSSSREGRRRTAPGTSAKSPGTGGD